MKHQRQAGFIRNFSSKQLPTFQPEPSQFSYFRPRPLNDQGDEFSPYKMEHEVVKNKLPNRPPLPQQKNKQLKQQAELKAQGQKIYTRLKERMNSYEHRKDKSKQKLQTNISSVRNKIESIQNAIQELKVSGQRKAKVQEKMHKFEADPSGSSSCSSSSESEEVVVTSIPSPKMSLQKQQQVQKIARISHQRQEQNKQSSRDGTVYQRQNIITFNSRVSNNPPLQIKSYSSSEEQDEDEAPQIYEKRSSQFIHDVKPQSYVEDKGKNIAKKDVFKNKGGICFEIDTKQFAEPVIIPREDRHPKKTGKIDKKAQLIKRRETAKAYDKLARKALFTAYH